MKTVSLDPNDRTINCPAVLVEPKQIREYVTKRLETLGENLENLTPKQIMDTFITSMMSEEFGWSTIMIFGRACLLSVHVSIERPKTNIRSIG